MNDLDGPALARWVPRLFQAQAHVTDTDRPLFAQAFLAIQLLRLSPTTPWPASLAQVSPVDWHERCRVAAARYPEDIAACLHLMGRVFLALGAQAQAIDPANGRRLDPPGQAWLTWKVDTFFSSLGASGQRVTYSVGCDTLDLLRAKVAQMRLVAVLARQHRVPVGLDGVQLPFSHVATVSSWARETTGTAIVTIDFLPTAVMQGYLNDQMRFFQLQHAWWRHPRRRWRVMRQRHHLEDVADTARQQALFIVRRIIENLSLVPVSADVLRIPS